MMQEDERTGDRTSCPSGHSYTAPRQGDAPPDSKRNTPRAKQIAHHDALIPIESGYDLAI